MTGRGGLPLSLFLTPDGAPFQGGTYFPKSASLGRDSFLAITSLVFSGFFGPAVGLCRKMFVCRRMEKH
ncbi:DUF255 domain-containing protein [bacterium]|nr:DUF255 domain-containing protein [bacterium]